MKITALIYWALFHGLIAAETTERNLIDVVITGEDIKNTYKYAKERIPVKARKIKGAFKKKLINHLGAVELDSLIEQEHEPPIIEGHDFPDTSSELDSDTEHLQIPNARLIKAGMPYIV